MNTKRKQATATGSRPVDAESATTTPPAPAPRPRNPHCEPLWPATAYVGARVVHGFALASLRRDLTAIATLADLLAADADIAASRADSDNADDEPMPLTPAFSYGLQCALRSCAASAIETLEWHEDSAVEFRRRSEAVFASQAASKGA